MKYQLSTRYALYAALEMAAAPAGQPVSAAEVAERYRLPPTVVAKVIQRLVRAGLAVGSRGVTGGYRLARPPAQISLLELMEVFEGGREEATPAPSNNGSGGGAPGQLAEERLQRLFDEIDAQARATFASVSLATLVAPRQPLAAGAATLAG